MTFLGNFIKKYKIELIILVLLTCVYFFLRLYRVLSLPIFTDEAIYVRWSQIANQDASWRFISLTDGKQPMFIWFAMIFMRIFDDPLLAGRMVSVIAGLFSMIGLYFLGREVFKNKWIGIISSFLYLIFPMAFVYDRMALYDSMVAMFFVWSLYLQILLVRKLRLDIALILGIVLGGAVLTKSSGFLSIYLFPFLLLMFDFRRKDLKERLIKFVCLSLVSIVMAYAMYGILRLSPFYHIIADKNLTFIQTPTEWMKLQFADKISTFLSNSRGLWDWFITYFTIPYILLVLSAFFLSFKFLKEKLLLLFWFFLPFLALCVFGKTLYPRYILFMTMSLIPLVSYALYELSLKFKKRWAVVILFIIVFALPVKAGYYIFTDFAHAPIPSSDLEQYVNGWPAGGGVKESVIFFKREVEKGPIYIATEGTFGLMPYSYEIYLVDNPNITIKGLWPIKDEPPKELLDASKKMPVYVVFYQPCPSCKSNGEAPSLWPLTLVKKYEKGNGQNNLSVYQIRK